MLKMMAKKKNEWNYVGTSKFQAKHLKINGIYTVFFVILILFIDPK